MTEARSSGEMAKSKREGLLQSTLLNTFSASSETLIIFVWLRCEMLIQFTVFWHCKWSVVLSIKPVWSPWIEDERQSIVSNLVALETIFMSVLTTDVVC